MSKKILIYGAYGYTGKLVLAQALEKGYRPMLAGRNERDLKILAEKHQLSYKAFPLTDTDSLVEILEETDLVLHIAGPYKFTAKPMVEACLATQTHYVDVTGEIEVFEWVAAQHQRAERAGIVLLSGAGFDVVPTDCLAAYLHQQLPSASHLELAFKGVASLSRGTALTMLESMDQGGMIRQNAKLKQVPTAYKTREIPFGNKRLSAVSIPWGDVATAYHSTGIPNIITYMAASPSLIKQMRLLKYIGPIVGLPGIKQLLQAGVSQNIKGPSPTDRAAAVSFIWGEVRNAKGDVVQAAIQTCEGYTLTAITAMMSAENILINPPKAGFHTPATAFGADFILSVPGTERTLLTSD